jgi:hypothetical protein
MGFRSELARCSLAAALVVVVPAVGCGPTGLASPAGSTTPSGTASPSSIASASSSTGASPTAPASSGPETPPASGMGDAAVTVSVERDQYAPGERIDLQVRNGLSDSITTVDQQAFCTILRLDQAVGTGWEEVHNCLSGPPPQDIVIKPGEQRTVTWETGLGKGVFRARLVYTIGGAFVAGKALEVESGRLTVG